MFCPQDRPPEGRKSSPDEAKMATSWAAVGRQMAAKTALEALLGSSWGGLGRSWCLFANGRLGPARRAGRPREAPGKGSRFW